MDRVELSWDFCCCEEIVADFVRKDFSDQSSVDVNSWGRRIVW